MGARSVGADDVDPEDVATAPAWSTLKPSITAAVAIGSAATLLVSVTSVLDFAYRSIPLHVALETTATIASFVATQSVYGRFRRTLELRDLGLTAALGMFASANLLFAAVPAVFAGEPGSLRTWAPVLGQLTATALLALSAFAPDRPVHRPQLAAARALVGCEMAIGAIAVLVLVAGSRLPVAVPPSAVPVEAPNIVGNPLVLAVQLVSAALFAAAAAGFGLRARRTDDALVRWVAVAATLGGFARLNYFLFPSLYTTWFYAGDALRLGCFLALLAGGIQETRRLQRMLAASAVVDERRRIANDLHDGVTQDLAFIVQQLRQLTSRSDSTATTGQLLFAAERALDESRHAVAALTRPPDAPLGEAMAAAAREAAAREGGAVEIDVVRGVRVPARTQQEILRVVREAVINAVRHGRASRIRVAMREEPRLCVSIIDDGAGFDPAAPRRVGHVGLDSMTARVRAIGGELRVASEPGQGTEVRLTLP